MGDVFKETAEKAAARVDQTEMMMDPVTIVAILTQVLPIVASCFNRNDSPDPAMATEKFHEMYLKDPHKMRKRLARRIRGEADQPMSKEHSFVLADALIKQLLETPASCIQQACNEAPAGL